MPDDPFSARESAIDGVVLVHLDPDGVVLAVSEARGDDAPRIGVRLVDWLTTASGRALAEWLAAGAPWGCGPELVAAAGAWRGRAAGRLEVADGVALAITGVYASPPPIDRLRGLLDRREQFERLAAEISRAVSGVEGDDVDRAIARALSQLRTFARAEFAYVFQYDADADTFSLFDQAHGEGSAPLAEAIRHLPRGALPGWASVLERGEIVRCVDVDRLEAEFAVEQASAQVFGVRAVLVAPLLEGPRIAGALALADRQARPEWDDVELGLAEHVARVFAQVFGRQRERRNHARLEARFRALVVSLPEPAACLDARGRPVLWNPAFASAGALAVALARPGDANARPDLRVAAAAFREAVDAIERGIAVVDREVRWSVGTGEPSERWFSLRLVPHGEGEAREILVFAQDITERRQRQEELQRKAEIDELTGMANAYALADATAAALRRASNFVTLLFIDLDRIKAVNDMLGHDVGDGLLTAVAQRLNGEIDPGDLIARKSGDKFAILSTRPVDQAHGLALAERFLQCFSSPFRVGEHELYVAATAGMVQAKSKEVEYGELARRCDLALMRAKQRSRGQVEVYDHTMHVEMQRRATSEQRLRQALRKRELVVLYQPEVDVGGAHPEVVGVEALLRWRQPDGRLVSAFEFISVAEETSLILEIGEWVLEQSLRQAALWHAADPTREALGLKVNLSPRQLNQRDLPKQIDDLLRTTGAPAEWLTLELTETALIGDPESAYEVMNGLHEQGVSLAIDDFGTGYSSFAYLKRFPIDLVKVDRSFLQGFPHDVEDTTIVRTIVGLARALGLGVVAEGVEREEQVDALRAIGCRRAQGFLFSRAVDPETIAALRGDPSGLVRRRK